MDGKGIFDPASTLGTLVFFAALSVPIRISVFSAAERWAKQTGRLKRQG